MAITYRDALQKLIDHADLTIEESHDVFSQIMDGALTEVQIGGLLTALSTKGPAVAEIAGAARAMREHAVHIDTDGMDVLDIVGTGGTGKSTFNISTTSAMVLAGAGAKVAKHGNVTNTRASGSADVLMALGVKIDIEPAAVTRCIREAGVGFCYARACHPAMRFAAPVRKQLPVRTIFNVLGPLTNPAGAKRQVMGVFLPDWTEPLAKVLAELGAERAWVVCSEDGLDELAISAPTRISEYCDGQISSRVETPENLGLSRGAMEDILIDSPQASARAVNEVLGGQEGPKRDIVLLNAAAGLVVAGLADDLAAGVQQARQAIDSGAAAGALQTLIEVSHA